MAKSKGFRYPHSVVAGEDLWVMYSVYHSIYQSFIAQWDEDYYVVSYGLQLRDP